MPSFWCILQSGYVPGAVVSTVCYGVGCGKLTKSEGLRIVRAAITDNRQRGFVEFEDSEMQEQLNEAAGQYEKFQADDNFTKGAGVVTGLALVAGGSGILLATALGPAAIAFTFANPPAAILIAAGIATFGGVVSMASLFKDVRKVFAKGLQATIDAYLSNRMAITGYLNELSINDKVR